MVIMPKWHSAKIRGTRKLFKVSVPRKFEGKGREEKARSFTLFVQISYAQLYAQAIVNEVKGSNHRQSYQFSEM